MFILFAREMLHGHLPYVSIFDTKPLGGPVPLAIGMAIFGQKRGRRPGPGNQQF